MAILIDDWAYGGFLAALALCIGAFGLARYLPLPLLLVFLLMPAYMIHQAEEHFGNRFRDFLDREIGKGCSVLSNVDIFIVNVPGVWGVFALSFALASTVDIGFGLIPAYAALINVVAHLVPAARMRRSNPGLVTAILMLLPLSTSAIAAIGAHAGVFWHVLGIVTALITHAIIFGLAARRVRAA